MKTLIVGSLCLAVIGLNSGCVTGRRQLDLNAPSVAPNPVGDSKGALSIGTIEDDRQFENKPGSPSTPSIDGDVTKLSAAAKSTFIGRQRNTFGHGMGDIVLQNGQTVQSKVSDLISEGLRQRGYSILVDAAAQNSVSVDIDQFWTWMTPGFVALSFEAQVSCRVTIILNGKQVMFHVRGYGLNHGQFAKNVNWQEAYDIAFKDFLNDFDLRLNRLLKKACFDNMYPYKCYICEENPPPRSVLSA